MPNKKDICPECGVNEKGIRAKTCRPCSVKALAAINKKAEENNNLLTKAAKAATETVAAVEHMHKEAGNSETVFGPGTEPELMGVDLAKPGEDRSVIVTHKPGKEPEFKEVSSPEVKSKPPRVGEITSDGKFYK